MKVLSQLGYSFSNLIGAITTGLFIGYERQIIADSGQVFPNKILTSILIATGSYFLAFLLCNKRTIYHLPDWSLIAVFGSVICFFSLHVIKYSIDNWNAIGGIGISYFPVGLVIITPIYSFIALLIIGTIQFIHWLVKFVARQFNTSLK
jgi:hypothetical protein